MDLNHLQLPASLVAELYPASLVEDRQSTPFSHPSHPENKEIKAPLEWLGGNEKKVLVIVNKPDTVYLPEEELAFLTRVIGACKLSLGDVAIVNKFRYPGKTYKEITGSLQSRIILLFDVEPVQMDLPVNFPHYQLQPFAGMTILYAPSLQVLMNNETEKGKLWGCLKRLFNL